MSKQKNYSVIQAILMPTQVFIISPKPRHVNKPLGVTSSDKISNEQSDSDISPINEQKQYSSDQKLSILKRINPPERLIDNLYDWDDEEQNRFSYRTKFIRQNRQKYKEPLPHIQEIEPIHTPSVNAIVSAPIVELPANLNPINSTDYAVTIKQDGSIESNEIQGQTLLHLAAKLGHEDIMRMLISETSQANILLNTHGQTPLLCAIEAGSTSTATLLIEQDPLSLTCKDNIGSGVFHYATEQRNDIILNRAISILKRLSSSAARAIALQRLIEKNAHGKTPFIIAIEKGSLKCIKSILNSKWLYRNTDIGDFINSDSLKTTIDNDQFDIVSYLVSDIRRFEAIIRIRINANGRIYNVLEYSIALKKPDFVRIFISVRIPGDERELYRSYKYFLKHFNLAYSGSNYDQTPIQRMLTMTEMVPLVPLLLEQFVGEDGIDLSIIDDCLRARPAANRCLFGRSKTFSSTNWLKQHPLSLIVTANHPPVFDHDVVRICVDLKFQLFGNFLYLSILIVQILYVFLYTTVSLVSPTPSDSYYDVTNYTCKQLCVKLRSNPIDPLPGNVLLQMLRYLLLLCSCLGLLKELFQVLSQRQKYFRELFINFLELQAYICGILFSIDLNHCTQVTGLRCKWQWESGALGIASVWTLLLFVFMNALKIGKYGLLFVSVFLNFLKFCLIYVFIWIGYIIAFHMLFIHKTPQFTYIFYAIPKTLAMLTGEYDFDDLFFPNGRVLHGSQAAMVLFSIFVFTMNIVIMNIMVGLAVADVKSFRLNAKREHLRARIETCLGLQAKFGLLCETCSRLVLALSRHPYISSLRFYGLTKYHLWKLELRTIHINLPRPLFDDNPASVNRIIKYNNSTKDVTCETGYYREHIDRNGEQLLQENDYQRLTHRLDDVRDVFEKANGRVHHELRKLILSLQSDFDEIKRNLLAN